MAIRVANVGQSDLRLSSQVTKRNFLSALSTGPFAGEVVGHWRAFFVRLPAGYGALNQRFAMLGWDFGDTGTFGTTQDWVTRIPGGASATAPLRLQVQDNSTAAAWPGSEGVINSIQQFVVGTVYLVATGVCNTGTNASPVWRNFAAVCPVGGSASSQVGATASGASIITGTTQRIFNQVFVRQGTIRTPQDVAIEEVVYVTGDSPWDTVNTGAQGVVMRLGGPDPRDQHAQRRRQARAGHHQLQLFGQFCRGAGGASHRGHRPGMGGWKIAAGWQWPVVAAGDDASPQRFGAAGP